MKNTADSFFCIYSGRECPEEERSKEHIIPYALDGSDDFVTCDVAKIPNNEAGTSAALVAVIRSDRPEAGIFPPLDVLVVW